MKLLHLFFVLVFFHTICCGDELSALKNALSCLCSSNKKGYFGDCCSSTNIETDIDLEFIDCFGDIEILLGNVDELFVFSCSNVFIHFSDFLDKDITIIPGGCFSSLTHLTSLLPLSLIASFHKTFLVFTQKLDCFTFIRFFLWTHFT